MHRHYNGIKTVLLFGVMWALLLLVGGAIAAATGRSMFIWIFALIGLFSTFYSYWNSDKLALRAMRAYPVSQNEAPAMYRIVRELSQKAGQPMPSLHIAPTQTPNAFATGRDPRHAAVCCTEGILQILDERELRGVLAHELMHVYNRDILTSSIAAAVAGLITSAAQMMFWFGGMFGGGNSRDSENQGGGIFGVIGSLVMVLLAPIGAQLIQLAISRTREFDADEDGARLAEDPLALASALKKLDAGTTHLPLAHTPETEKVGFMMIANPFKGLGIGRLMSTHPPMEERIRRLEQMAGY